MGAPGNDDLPPIGHGGRQKIGVLHGNEIVLFTPQGKDRKGQTLQIRLVFADSPGGRGHEAPDPIRTLQKKWECVPSAERGRNNHCSLYLQRIQDRTQDPVLPFFARRRLSVSRQIDGHRTKTSLAQSGDRPGFTPRVGAETLAVQQDNGIGGRTRRQKVNSLSLNRYDMGFDIHGDSPFFDIDNRIRPDRPSAAEYGMILIPLPHIMTIIYISGENQSLDRGRSPHYPGGLL
ncbi:uncharacterized protein Dmul_07520 [Desulfococcus multivorans]|nr:uncharacterized protein Dmul_07520 [Desulfococcus multivorans]